MDDLLQLIGKKKTEKILSHQNFSEGIHDLIRQGYVVVKDDHFLLTPKGEIARKEGIKPETDLEDPAQLKRNNLNRSITALPPNFTKDPKSIFILMMAFFIFLLKFLPGKKIIKSKPRFKWWKK